VAPLPPLPSSRDVIGDVTSGASGDVMAYAAAVLYDGGDAV